MAKGRMIPIVTFEDPRFGKLELGAMVLFIGIIVIADDEGRLRADPTYLKSRILGYKNVRVSEVKKWRDEIEKNVKGILVYEVDGEEYIQLTKWEKYQTLRADRVVKSTYPASPHGLPTCMSASMTAKKAAEVKLREVKLSKAKGREGKSEGKGNLPPAGGRKSDDILSKDKLHDLISKKKLELKPTPNLSTHPRRTWTEDTQPASKPGVVGLEGKV